MRMGKGKIPDRWLPYSPMGTVVPGTSFIACKVPLKDTLLRNLPENERFGPRHLMETFPNIGLLVDLTNTDRYYMKEEFTTEQIQYEKIYCPGQVIPPNSIVKEFYSAVDRFLEQSKESDSLIAVHCTHGVNRTGYFICRYMIEKLNIPPDDAVERFQEARGHKIERQPYLDDLKNGCKGGSESDVQIKPWNRRREGGFDNGKNKEKIIRSISFTKNDSLDYNWRDPTYNNGSDDSKRRKNEDNAVIQTRKRKSRPCSSRRKKMKLQESRPWFNDHEQTDDGPYIDNSTPPMEYSRDDLRNSQPETGCQGSDRTWQYPSDYCNTSMSPNYQSNHEASMPIYSEVSEQEPLMKSNEMKEHGNRHGQYPSQGFRYRLRYPGPHAYGKQPFTRQRHPQSRFHPRWPSDPSARFRIPPPLLSYIEHHMILPAWSNYLGNVVPQFQSGNQPQNELLQLQSQITQQFYQQNGHTQWTNQSYQQNDQYRWTKQSSQQNDQSQWTKQSHQQNDQTHWTKQSYQQNDQSQWTKQSHQQNDQTQWTKQSSQQNEQSQWTKESYQQNDQTQWTQQSCQQNDQTQWIQQSCQQNDQTQLRGQTCTTSINREHSKDHSSFESMSILPRNKRDSIEKNSISINDNNFRKFDEISSLPTRIEHKTQTV